MSEDSKQSDQDLADEWAAALEEQTDDNNADDDWASAMAEQADAEAKDEAPKPDAKTAPMTK
ncbi:MAG TPA: flagellar motor switch protein FliN, partial [Methylophaga sp.]|nr:flagellar motor switch protein FliN [Methylophaga sp.]